MPLAKKGFRIFQSRNLRNSIRLFCMQRAAFRSSCEKERRFTTSLPECMEMHLDDLALGKPDNNYSSSSSGGRSRSSSSCALPAYLLA